jgi:type II secretory pathway pseudopilin PulG
VISHLHAVAGREGHRSSEPARADERGETLAEVLVTIVLMGIGFLAVLSAIFTSVNVSTINADRTAASLNVQGWAETLQQPSRYIPPGSTSPPSSYSTYVDCANPGSYGTPSTGGGTLNPGFTATIVSIDLLTDFTGGQPNFTTPLGTCYGSGDKGLQRITLRVESPTHKGKKAVETVTIVKRDSRCPATFNNADLGPC